MRRRTISSEKKPLYSGYGSSFSSYGTANGYQSQPLLSSVDYHSSFSPPSSPTENYVNYKTTIRNETMIDQDSRIGTIKENYYNEVRSKSYSPTHWIWQVIQEMLRYIYTSIAQIKHANCATSNTTDYPEPELKLDPNTQ